LAELGKSVSGELKMRIEGFQVEVIKKLCKTGRESRIGLKG
jgi:hypothetical protein